MGGLTGSDVTRILALADGLERGEIDLTLGDTRIVIRKGQVAGARAAAAPAQPATTPVTEPGQSRPKATGRRQAGDDREGGLVLSPLAGTFYRSPRPGAEPFVGPGDPVTPDTVIGIVELMKLMNSVPAGIAGEIVGMLVADGQTIEAGTGLRVDTHIQSGAVVPPFYDSMIGKLIACGADREAALTILDQALRVLKIEGVTTKAALHRRILADAGFRRGGVDTSYLAGLLEQGNSQDG